MDRLHPLQSNTTPPGRMNNPMGYIPHPLCIEAATEVQKAIGANSEWKADADRGKMFGVLVVTDNIGGLGFLAAYSGLLANRNDWHYFVPPVFDFQQPDGYFKTEEAKITDINRQVAEMEQDATLREQRTKLAQLKLQTQHEMQEWKMRCDDAKHHRDAIRQGTAPATMTEEQMVAESQWMKAETRRLRKRHTDTIAAQQLVVGKMEASIDALRRMRKEKSEALQKWLFDNFMMLNAAGERRSLTDIFAATPAHTPPSGAGECCAPKLLQYAFAHNLQPLCIAEFWWGDTPTGELRQHGHYYPACRGKCLPILQHMLQGLDVQQPTHGIPTEATPEIVYEDQWIMVVDKPHGMLSVPGKTDNESVWHFARKHCPEADGPLIVHRLDMDTAGLMVIAKTKEAHQKLQAQFRKHTVKKTYLALLERPLPPGKPQSGTINLPLRPDHYDRPRQMVDTIHGKTAITTYAMTGPCTVTLHPLTGRTHQLRVHCAHPDGLGIPILGDSLYGTPAGHLHLRAAEITFIHPHTGKDITFSRMPSAK